MRYLQNFVLLLWTIGVPICMISSCKSLSKQEAYDKGVEYGIDTMTKVAQPLIDSACHLSNKILIAYDLKNDTVIKYKDSIALLRNTIDSLNKLIKYADYRNGRIVTKIQYYIDITDKRPANRTFFYGWVKRAMRQEK